MEDLRSPEALRQRMARLAADGRIAQAVSEAEAALVGIDASDVGWDVVRVELVGDLRRMNRRVDAERHLELVLGRGGASLVLGHALVEASFLLRGAHDLAGAVRAARRAAQVAHGLSDTALVLRAERALAEALSSSGDHAGADEALARAMDACTDSEDRLTVLLGEALLAARSGDWRRAVEVGERVVAIAEPLGATAALHEAGVMMARAAMARGTHAEATRAVRRALPWARATGMSVAEAEIFMLMGELARRGGRADEARHAYQQAREAYGEDGYARFAELNLALVEAEEGRWDEADALAEPLEAPLVDHPVVSVLVALLRVPSAARRGDYARVDSALVLARLRLAQAVDRDEAVLALAAADVCESLGSAGRERAVQLLALAFAVWSRLHLRSEADEANARLHRLRSQGAPVPLGPFLLDRPIGRGAMGEVWTGRHAGSGTPVAVKLLTGGIAHDAGALEALRRETEALAGLDHPAILAVLAQGTVEASAAAAEPRLVEGTPWLATELATGGALTPSCGRLPWATCRLVLLAVLDALAHAHAHGLVHLDLKAGNVLMEGDAAAPAPRLADFGLARALGDAEAGKRVGTPSHMAPEQHAGDIASYGPWTDLYGVGCLATELVSGAPPFVSRSVDELRDAHFVQEPPPLQPAVAVPRGLEAWIRRLLCKAPEDRFQLAADAAAALERLGPPEVPGVPLSIGREAASELPTVMLPAAPGRSAPLAWADDREPCPIPPPQVSLTWQRRLPDVRRPSLVDAGLSLFQHRRPRPTGRQLERGLLWAQLRQVASDGRCRGVLVAGTRGVGRGHLCTWLGERAHEVGAALPLVLSGRPDPAEVLDRIGDLARSRSVVVTVPSPEVWAPLLSQNLPALCLLPVEEGREGPWARHPAVLHLQLEPLEPEEVAGLLRSLLPLASDLLSELVEAADGNPGRAMAGARALVDAGALILRADGYALRPGAELPNLELDEPAHPSSGLTTFLEL